MKDIPDPSRCHPGYRIDHMPFGGVKESGMGREGLRWAMEDMTELRLMVIAPVGG